MKRRDPDPRSAQELWEEQHALMGNLPLAWLVKANELMEAFEALVREDQECRNKRDYKSRLSWAAYMLSGFAIENLLKGILVGQKHSFKAGGRFNLKSHDLHDLARLASIEISEQESLLLEKLKEFIVWAGRYPIPLESDAMRPRETPGGGFASIPNHFPGEDWPAIRGFVSKLKGLLPTINYGGNTPHPNHIP